MMKPRIFREKKWQSLLRQHGSVLVRPEGSQDVYLLSEEVKRFVPPVHLATFAHAANITTISALALEGIPEAEPHTNTRKRNYEHWGNEYDWSQRGDEWTPSDEWKQALIDDVLLRWIGRDGTVLEIGPGAGRWTETLQEISERLLVADITEKSIQMCKERFAHCKNIEYFVNDGKSLDFVADETIDYIWSFDVFVHIDREDTAAYLAEFRRILKVGGYAVIHHPNEQMFGGWRSSVTSDFFAGLVRENGLTLIEQFDSWGDGRFDVRYHHDFVSVFRK